MRGFFSKKDSLLPIMHFFNDGYLAIMPLLLPFISYDIPLSLSLIGFLGSLLNLSGMFLAIPAAYFSTRFGNIRVLTIAIIGYTVGFISIAFASNTLLIINGFLVASISFGLFHPIAFSTVAKNSNSNIGKKMGTFAAFGDIGRVILSTLTSFLIVVLLWRKVSILYAIIGFLFFMFSIMKTKGDTQSYNINKKEQKDFSIFKNKKFNYYNISSTLDSFANASLFIFLPQLFIHKNITLNFVGVFTSAFFIGNLLGKLAIGFLVDHLRKESVFTLCEIIIAACLILLSFVSNMVAVICLAFILGFFSKGTVPVTSTMIAESIKDSKQLDNAFSINSLSTSIANTIAPLLLGIVADMAGIQIIFGICATTAVLSITPLIILKTKGE